MSLMYVAHHSRNNLQNGVHHFLKNGWGRGDPKSESVIDIEAFVSVRYGFDGSSTGNWRQACDRSNFENTLPPDKDENGSSGVGKGYSYTASAWLMVTL